jgi:DNA-binding IclR family transcriptional regulator
VANSPSGDSMISRIVRILSAFDSAKPALSIAALARRADIPLATTHRLVKELADQGLLQKDAGGEVRVGIRMWELANRSSAALDLRQAALPFMEDIQAVVRQHTQLGILQKDEVLFIERLSSPGSVVNRAKVAGRLPVHVSSSGLVLLAYAPVHVQEEYLRKDLQKLTGSTITEPEQLRRTLAEIRQYGYAALPGFVDEDTMGIAVPVLDGSRKAIAALGVVVARDYQQIHGTIPALMTAARGIARAMGQADAEAHQPHGVQPPGPEELPGLEEPAGPEPYRREANRPTTL